MKGFVVSIVAILMALSASSQDLTPLVFINQGDTIIGFTTSQSKLLAKGIIRKQQCDSLLSLADEKEVIMIERVQVKNEQIRNLQGQITNKDQQISIQQEIVDNKDEEIGIQKKRIRGLKVKKTFAIIGMAAIGVLSIK